MFFLYLALIFFIAGILTWIAGNIVYKRLNRQKGAARSKSKRHVETLGTAAKIIFILAALFFVIGFMLVQGAQTV